MLRASARVLRSGGRLAFLVIVPADHLTPQDVAILVERDIGPVHVDAGPGYVALMQAAGFGSIEVIDVSDDFLATAAAWIRERDAESAELEPMLGREQFEERQASSRRSLEAIEAGLLRRYLITGVR